MIVPRAVCRRSERPRSAARDSVWSPCPSIPPTGSYQRPARAAPPAGRRVGSPPRCASSRSETCTRRTTWAATSSSGARPSRHHRAAGHDVRVLTTDVRFGEPRRARRPRVLPRAALVLEGPRAGRGSRPAQRFRLERDNARTLRRHLDRVRARRRRVVGDGRDVAVAAGRARGVPSAAFVLDDWLDYAPQRGPVGPPAAPPALRHHHDRPLGLHQRVHARARARRTATPSRSSEINPAGVGRRVPARGAAAAVVLAPAVRRAHRRAQGHRHRDPRAGAPAAGGDAARRRLRRRRGRAASCGRWRTTA